MKASMLVPMLLLLQLQACLGEKRIIGGLDVTSNETQQYSFLGNRYPTGVKSSEGGGSCGVALIGPRHVLTAAHCDFNMTENGYKFQIILGCIKILDNNVDDCQIITVQNCTKHPLYDVKLNDTEGGFSNDIQVCELVRDASDGTALAKLPELLGDNNYYLQKEEVEVAGWGTTTTEYGTQESNLRYTTVTYNTLELCQDKYVKFGSSSRWYNGIFTGNPSGQGPDLRYICASSLVAKDSCSGDSGSLLYSWADTPINVGGGKTILQAVGVGVVSWGISCADFLTPGVYTRVFSYRDWVKNLVPDLDTYPAIVGGAFTESPTDLPTTSPTGMPTRRPSATSAPTDASGAPTPEDDRPENTRMPTPLPTPRTKFPTTSPTAPTPATGTPTNRPTRPTFPTGSPTDSPTSPTTLVVTGSPTTVPTGSPTDSPTTGSPTVVPTGSPTDNPTSPTTAVPTGSPTDNPTSPTTLVPTGSPTEGPKTPNWGTCQGNCGQKGSSSAPDTMQVPNCDCDRACETFQDCCVDYLNLCASSSIPFQGQCKGNCDRTTAFANGCYCDAGCVDRRDCCPDYNQCDGSFPQIRLAPQAGPAAPPLPPLCRDSLVCTEDAAFPFGSGCATYAAGGHNAGYCGEDAINMQCPVTCGGDDAAWEGDYGNCQSYLYSNCLSADNNCNFNYCATDAGAKEHCPVACGVCRMEEQVGAVRATRASRAPRSRSPRSRAPATGSSRASTRGRSGGDVREARSGRNGRG